MRNFLKLSAALVLLMFIFPSYAAKVLECKDERGNITYQDHCPPGTSPVNEKTYNTDGNQPTSKPEISATLYVIPDCDACQEVRDFLSLRKIPVTEINVNDDMAGQKELKEKAGELKVPVTIIGESIVKGYNRQKLLDALKTAGYGEPENENKPEQKPENQSADGGENQAESQSDSEQNTK